MSGVVRSRSQLPLIALTCFLSFLISGRCLGASEISGIEMRPVPRAIALAINASGEEPPKLRVLSLEAPTRLVVDLLDANLAAGLPDTLPVDKAGIRQIRIAQFQRQPDIVRLVCDLQEGAALPNWKQSVGQKPSELLLTFTRGELVALALPKVEKAGGALFLRLGGAAGLPRKAGELSEPARVYLDLTGAVLEAPSAQDFAAGPIRQIRMAPQPADDEEPLARVVVEFRDKQQYTLYAEGEDLVLAVGEQPWALPLPKYRPARRLKGQVIVVDPGHGGKDVGAPAVMGPPAQPPFEKEIVLDIGRRLARLLKAEGAQVTMTRSDDTFITLQERAAIANRLQADAFISIHCNSSAAADRLSGTSVYFDHEHSAIFAEIVQEELIAALGTPDKGTRNANFAVIRRTVGPGILVETAFINHQQDRARLMHPNFRERVARAVLRGVVRFTAQEAKGGGRR